MNKTEIAFIRERVDKVVMCTCGTLATKTNKLQAKIRKYSMAEKIAMIRNGQAKLLTNQELECGVSRGSYPDKNEALITCFTYPEHSGNKAAQKINEKHQNKLEELTQEVHLEGERLVDLIFLGLVEKKDIPTELNKLAKMSDLL